MKKRQNNSARASALQTTIIVVLLLASAILFASNFMAASRGAQDGFYPPLPVPAIPVPVVPDGVPGITVALPIDSINADTVPTNVTVIEPVTTTLIDNTTTGGLNYVGFQGDFTYDSAVIGFATSGPLAPPVRGAGLTSDPSWNVASNVLNTGPGTIKTIRVSAISTNFIPLNGTGTLFELRPFRVGPAGSSTNLVWAAPPNRFTYFDDELGSHTPTQTNGLITITGIPPTPSPTPTATATATGAPPTLGNYPDNSIPLSTDTTVTPDAAPTDTMSITVSSSTNFKGKLEGYPTTGVVRITNAHPAGTHTITVTAFNPGGSTVTRTFTLMVTTPVTCPLSFAPAVGVGVGTNPFSVAVGDFNGDGDQDFAVANSDSDNVSILLGDGAGHFSAATNFAVGNSPTSVVVGDFNGDGRQDLATANNISNNVSILLGDGTGNFSAATNFSASVPYSIVVGDFNNDGKQDLALAGSGSSSVVILLGDGAGNFGAPSNFPVGDAPLGVAVGDFNGDGKQDLATANLSSNNVSIVLGDGAGNFSAPTNFGVDASPYSVTVGDFNGDGKQDLAVTLNSNFVSILRGNGDGSFTAPTNFSCNGSDSRSLAVGDFNGDGKQDVAVANRLGSRNVTILLGDGLGNLSLGTTLAVGAGTFPHSVAAGDFNGDGKQDLVSANESSNDVSIFLRSCGSTPAPTSTATATSTGTPTPTSTATATATATATGTPCPAILFDENFDGVIAPALPAGWVATNPDPGDGIRWVTSATAPDSVPNDAFVPDQDGISDKVLVTPNIPISSSSAVLSFRNNFNTEFSDGIYWDGGVLEVSINGGAFIDITAPAVGGSFISGGYTGEIDGTANNPLAGRLAWSGNSGGYVNTVVNLGPNVAGQTIKLRFRMGSDEAVAAPGWRVDTLRVVDGACPSATPTATATTTAAPTATPSPTCQTYGITNSSASVVPGTTDIGNHTDDGSTAIALPFPVSLYGNTYTSAVAGSNGYLSFGIFANNFYSGCLPNSSFSYTIFPFETDQNTTPAGRGIFTLTSGSAPNRTFYIEWRNCLYSTATTCLANSNNNYEIIFQEGVSDFSIVYGTFESVNGTVGAIGVQDGTGQFTQSQCNLGRAASSQQTYSLCPPPTATPTATATATGTPICPPVITQSTSQTITTGNSVSCNNGTGHTDNSYWRAFNIASITSGAQYTISSVSFGVETANVSQPVTVRLYTTSNFPAGFPGSLTQIGTTTLNVSNAQNGTVVTTPLAAIVPAGTSQLVMELFTPDGQQTGHLFFVGSNSLGQTGPSYISAADCGISTPTDLAAIGFPGMHIIFNVNGNCGGGGTPFPTPTPTIPPPLTPTPVPATPTATATATATAGGTCVPLSQGFDDITVLPGLGWVQTNHSTVVGTTNWFQGNSTVFLSQSGAPTSYIAANFNNTTGTNTISNWLLTPPVTLQNGNTATFWTRTVDAPAFPDRLQVPMSLPERVRMWGPPRPT